jgi:deoxyhypusine synthase
MDLKKVNHIKVEKEISVNELVGKMRYSGVMGAGKIGKAAEIYSEMINDNECRIFLGVAGALVPGGMREILIDMLENGKISVLVCTGATLTHDLVEALGFSHFQGHHMLNDKELHDKGFDRIYDSLMPNEVYEKLELFFKDNSSQFERKMNITEFLNLLGSLISERSILKTCHDKKIPIFCPAIADSGIGLMIWGLLNKHKNIEVLAFDDLKLILDIAWTCKKPGIIYLGGGVPKNYIQQAMQFSPNQAFYGIQITMDRPEPGGSSGAELREGISWGKLNEKAHFVDVICDVTIALPLIWAGVKTRI